MAVAVAKALGAQPVILTGTRDNRLKIGLELGADAVINIRKEPDVVAAVKKLNGGKGVDYVVECSAATSAVTTPCAWSIAAAGSASPPSRTRKCRSTCAYRAQQHHPLRHPRRGQKRDAPRRGVHEAEAFRRHQIHTHTFSLDDLPTAIRYAKDRVEDAIKVVVKAKMDAAQKKRRNNFLSLPSGAGARRPSPEGEG